MQAVDDFIDFFLGGVTIGPALFILGQNLGYREKVVVVTEAGVVLKAGKLLWMKRNFQVSRALPLL